MSLRRAVSPIALVCLSLALTGCMSPWLKRAPNTPDPKPAQVLLAGFSVRFADSGEKSLLDAAVDAAQNAKLAEFGQQATALLTASLAEHGYTVAFDGPRSSRLDAIQLSSSSSTAALTGLWRHPDSSHQSPDTVDGLLVKPADVLSKIKVDGQKEFFAFAEVVIRDNGMFMKEPYVVVRTSVFDQDGKEVLDLQGLGAGESSFMFADRSPQNLKIALQRGFESLKTVEVQSLQ